MELFHLSHNSNVYHCQFNPSHTMPQKTLALHLSKCPDRPANYKTCTHNCLHILPASDLEKHEENCPDRILVDGLLYESADVVRPHFVAQDEPQVHIDDESWDEPEQTTNVIKNINHRPAFMKPAYGLTKSQRKNYRNQMHKNALNVDLSYNENMNMQKRQEASTSGIEVEGYNTQQQVKEKQLFIGKRPNV